MRVSTQLWRMFNCWRVFFLLFKFAIYLTFSVLDLFDVCDFDLLDLFLSSFLFRSPQSVPVLLYFHDVHQRSLGWRKDPWRLCQRVPSPSRRGIRKSLLIYSHKSCCWIWNVRDSLCFILFYFFIFSYFFFYYCQPKGLGWRGELKSGLNLLCPSCCVLCILDTTTVPPSLSARSFVRLSIRLKSGKHALSFFSTVAAAETRGPPVGWHTREQTRDSLVFNLVGLSFHALAVLFLILLSFLFFRGGEEDSFSWFFSIWFSLCVCVCVCSVAVSTGCYLSRLLLTDNFLPGGVS